MVPTQLSRTCGPWLYALTAVAAAAIGLSLVAPVASAAAVDPVRSGDAVIVDSSDGSRELTHGQSATQFSVRLPAGAACPGDSANDQWRVQSFMIPVADSPAHLGYNVAGPDGQGQFALYAVNTSPLVDSLTNQNTSPGQPGVIPAIPPLSFAAFPPGVLPAGTYRIGIACTLSRKTANYWDTEVVITSSPGDKPSQVVWRLPNVPESVNHQSNGTGRWLVPVGIGALAVVALAAWAFLPRKTPVPANVRRTPHKVNARRTPITANKPSRSHKVHSPSPRKATTHSKEPK
jgi:hypothetical protein